MKKIIIIAAVVVAVAAIYWLVIKKPSTIPFFGQKAGEKVTAPAESSALGGQIFEKVQQNPAEKLPDTNPFQKDLNPYKSGYTNPFK